MDLIPQFLNYYFVVIWKSPAEYVQSLFHHEEHEDHEGIIK
jgi:hypothetical protein